MKKIIMPIIVVVICVPLVFAAGIQDNRDVDQIPVEAPELEGWGGGVQIEAPANVIAPVNQPAVEPAAPGVNDIQPVNPMADMDAGNPGEPAGKVDMDKSNTAQKTEIKDKKTEIKERRKELKAELKQEKSKERKKEIKQQLKELKMELKEVKQEFKDKRENKRKLEGRPEAPNNQDWR
jgi:hypothetical protein